LGPRAVLGIFEPYDQQRLIIAFLDARKVMAKNFSRAGKKDLILPAKAILCSPRVK